MIWEYLNGDVKDIIFHMKFYKHISFTFFVKHVICCELRKF